MCVHAHACEQPRPEVTDKGSCLLAFSFFPVLTESVWAHKNASHRHKYTHTYTYTLAHARTHTHTGTHCYTMAVCGGCVGPLLSFHSLVLSIVSIRQVSFAFYWMIFPHDSIFRKLCSELHKIALFSRARGSSDARLQLLPNTRTEKEGNGPILGNSGQGTLLIGQPTP